jgi:predicted amidophosphoribosyltransferase
MSRQGPLKGPHRRAPKHSPYAGSTTCLRCDHAFWSWDRRQNRLCPRCKNELDQEPSEEPRRPFHPPTHRLRNQDGG